IEDARRVRTLRPDLPPEVDDLVARMLARDVEERPKASSLVVELRDLLRRFGDRGIPAPATRAVHAQDAPTAEDVDWSSVGPVTSDGQGWDDKLETIPAGVVRMLARVSPSGSSNASRGKSHTATTRTGSAEEIVALGEQLADRVERCGDPHAFARLVSH